METILVEFEVHLLQTEPWRTSCMSPLMEIVISLLTYWSATVEQSSHFMGNEYGTHKYDPKGEWVVASNYLRQFQNRIMLNKRGCTNTSFFLWWRDQPVDISKPSAIAVKQGRILNASPQECMSWHVKIFWVYLPQCHGYPTSSLAQTVTFHLHLREAMRRSDNSTLHLFSAIPTPGAPLYTDTD